MLFDPFFGLRVADKYTLRPKKSDDGASRSGAVPRSAAGFQTVGERSRIMQLRTVLSKDIAAVLSLAAIWVLAEALIHPAGEFPLNDDWSYTLSLQQWYDSHHYHLLGWTSMPLISQLTWGLVFCKIFGFSFTVLRYSTLVLGLAGGIGAYFLAREFTANKGVCLLAASILLLNPIYLNLSNTFMTDVPFTSFVIFSLLFFVKGLRQDKTAYYIQGFLFVLVATLLRQLGLLVACAFSAALLMKHGFSRRSLLIAALSVGLPLGIYLLYNHWLKAQHDYPIKYDEGFRRIKNNLFSKDHSTVKYLLRQALNIFLYTGAFIFPFIFVTGWRTVWRHRRSPAFFACLAAMAAVGIYCLVHRNNISLMGNIMNPYGLGVVDLRDGAILQPGNLHPLPSILWHLLCVAGIIGGGFLLWALVQGVRRIFDKDNAAVLFLIGFAALYCLVMLVGGTYDRYLIPLIPVSIVLLQAAMPSDAGAQESAGELRKRSFPSRIRVYAALAFLLAGAWFSIAGTANYLAWNRARWDGLHYLLDEKGIPSTKIDGGFAFNGYYGYNDNDISSLKDHPSPAKKSWWWVQDDAYVLAFGPIKGYSVLRTYPCAGTLFPASMESIYVLKRID